MIIDRLHQNRRACISRRNRRRHFRLELLEDRRMLSATVPDGTETLVNDFTPNTQQTRAETRAIASNAAGDLIVAFDGRGPDGFTEIYARRYDSNNAPQGGQFLVNTTTSGNQRYPSAALGPSGEAVVAWSGKGIGDNDGGVFIQRFDNTGAAIGGEFKVNQTTASSQQKPVVAKAPDGTFIVVWSGPGVGDPAGIFARRFAADGTPLTGEFLVNTTTTSSQQRADVAYSADGSYVIAWDGNGPGDPSGVFYQAYDSADAPLGVETRVNTTISGGQTLPSVGIDNANNVWITWSGFGNAPGNADTRGVFVRGFDSTGAALTGELLVNTTTLYDQEDASIAVDSDGFVITWTSIYQDGSVRGVYRQEFDLGGAKVGVESLVNTTTARDQQFSSVATRGGHRYVVAFSGNCAGDNSGVCFQSFQKPVPGSIHGYKFEDLNVNGIDDGEPRLAGVEIVLSWIDDNNQPQELSTFTDVNGEYSFQLLAPGIEYSVREVPPLGALQTTPDPAPIFVGSGQEYVALPGQAVNSPMLRPDFPGDGYLEFINPSEHPGLIGTVVPTSPPGVIMTEEFTGYTLASGQDIIETGDSDTTAGDRADFDWVQENRGVETGFPPGGSHAGMVGAMGWTVGTPEFSPHVDPGTGQAHGHSDEETPPGSLPHLDNDAYMLPFFAAVDVFSIISAGQDSDSDANGNFSPREAALDYVVDFVNSVTGAFSPGVLQLVWVPGWTAATTIDDYVARWIPATPGLYDFVAIEPNSGPNDDNITEIDAIKALPTLKPFSEIEQPDLVFGNAFEGSIHGYKFEDLNVNGIDDGEPRLAGVEIVVSWIDENNQQQELSTFTGDNGEYWFEWLTPGIEYTVREVPPAGSLQTTPDPAPIFVGSGQEYVALPGQAVNSPMLRPDFPGDGYLEFINPSEHPLLIGTPVPTSPPGVIMTEEFTGYTLASGQDIIETGDSDTTAGDRADFDWVQENRPIETGLPPGGNHPGRVGAMGWTVGTPEFSPHVDPGTGQAHGHSDEETPPGSLPHLDNDAYMLPFFAAVDVFSIISAGQDSDSDANGNFSPREAALDYVVDFVNSVTGAFSPGVLQLVWVPGWTAATTIDDYVARWVPTTPGLYNFVAIEPKSGPNNDQITEIDAIKALPTLKPIREIEQPELGFGNAVLPSPLPLRFDLNGSTSVTASGFIGVGTGLSNAYTTAQGYGWTTTSGAFDRGVPTALLRDAHFGTDNTYLVDLPNGNYVVNVTLGDASSTRDFVDVYAEGTLIINNLTAPVGQFVHRSFPVTVGDGQLTLRFDDDGGDPFFAVNAVEIYSSTLMHALTPLTPSGTEFDGSGATPGSTVTVSTTLGSVSSVDQDPNYVGVQVIADTAGSFTFSITPPSVSGTATISSEEVTGQGSGLTTFAYGPVDPIINNFTAGVGGVPNSSSGLPLAAPISWDAFRDVDALFASWGGHSGQRVGMLDKLGDIRDEVDEGQQQLDATRAPTPLENLRRSMIAMRSPGQRAAALDDLFATLELPVESTPQLERSELA